MSLANFDGALKRGLHTLACGVLSAMLVNSSVASDHSESVADSTTRTTTFDLQASKSIGRANSTYLEPTKKGLTLQKPQSRLDRFGDEIKPIFEANCIRCHGPDKQKGSFRIDTLDPDLVNGDHVEWWLDIVRAVSNSEMPPEDEDPMPDVDRAKLIEWLTTEIHLASQQRRSEEQHTSFRRMTRYEFNYALQDLLGLPYNFAGDLPPEANSEDGFQNSSELLHLTSTQFATYHELSHQALLAATVKGEQPTPLFWGVTMEAASNKEWRKQEQQLEDVRKRFKDDPERLTREIARRKARFNTRSRNTHYKNLATGQSARASWGYGGARYAWDFTHERPVVPESFDYVAIIPAQERLIVELGDQVPEEGLLRVRVRAAQVTPSNNRIPSLRLEFGWQASNNSAASVSIKQPDITITASPRAPQFYQWDVPLRDIYPRNSFRGINKMGVTPSPSEFIKLVNSSVSEGAIQIDYVEVTAPAYDQWPPHSHTKIFFDDSQTSDEISYATAILKRFMPKAWRRSISQQEIETKLELFSRLRPLCDDFQDTMVDVLATVIASPHFLYLTRSDIAQNGNPQLTDEELATRLAMFLWSSSPDEELRILAATNRLSDPEVLARQTERMLADPRSRRLSKHFVRQWLGLQLLDYLKVDREFFDQFDSDLRAAMQEEPIAFFQYVLNTNRSIVDFLHADYALINERLAKHYGISQVYGNRFRRVSLISTAHRGGLLTQSGLLAMNSDGKDSHPLKRGIWILERLLNDPPPPPPAAVPEIDLTDPEIAKLTLKERMEDHRNDAACRSCHVKIDPWGIALENFDAVGRWRDEINESPVDADSLLFNKQPLTGVEGLKSFLLTHRQDQFCRAVVLKLTTYALGRPLTFGDRAAIDEITAASRQNGDRLGDLIPLIVTSKLFQTK